ncbi:MAG: hypothetical protein NVS3B25_30970 [Hymenobacter sp.]
MSIAPSPIERLDWEQLRAQKAQLVTDLWDVECEDESNPRSKLWGLVHFIDDIQDYATEDLGLSEEEVYGESEEDDFFSSTPCIICGGRESSLHVSGRCGNCGPGPTDN